MNRQNPWDHDAINVKFPMIKFNRLKTCRRGLYREMYFHFGVFRGDIFKVGDIRENQHIDAFAGRPIDGFLPYMLFGRIGESINRNMKLAPKVTGDFYRFLQPFLRKIQSWEMSGIGLIFQADISRISTILKSRF